MKNSVYKLAVFCFLLTYLSCSEEETSTIEYISLETLKPSSESSLHLSADGNVYLSWIESDSISAELKFATLEEEKTWSVPTTIATGNNWFVNWADFPSLQTFGQNMAAHYLVKSADDTYAYDVNLTISNDNGETWQSAFVPHTDGTHTEHGFVSKSAINSNEFLSVWLDGRLYAAAEQDSTIAKEMTLRAAVINQSNELVEEYLLDARVCDCCQTDVAMTNEGAVVVYRDRSDDEMRDIYFVRLVDGQWTQPEAIYNDNWNIEGCPVNGPAIDAMNSTVAVSWFSMNDGSSQVKVSFSLDNGQHFDTPIKVDYINPIGRVDIAFLNENKALVSWMDLVENDAIIKLQSISSEGVKSQPIELAKSSESRSSGFPRLVVKGDFGYVSWTNVNEENSKIEVAKIDLNTLK